MMHLLEFVNFSTYRKQTEILHDAIGALNGENQKQSMLAQQLDKELERLSKRKRELDDAKLYETNSFEQRRGEISMMERQVDDIFKEHELAKEQLAFQKTEKVRLEFGLKKVVSDVCIFCDHLSLFKDIDQTCTQIKREHDAVLKSIREKDTHLKMFRRLTMTVGNIKMQKPSLKKQQDELKRLITSSVQEEKYQKKKLAEVRKEIDLALYDSLKMEKMEKEEMEKVKALMSKNQELEAELEHVTDKANELTRQIDDVKTERDLKVLL
jgi:chromosome segregation ATPase